MYNKVLLYFIDLFLHEYCTVYFAMWCVFRQASHGLFNNIKADVIQNTSNHFITVFPPLHFFSPESCANCLFYV